MFSVLRPSVIAGLLGALCMVIWVDPSTRGGKALLFLVTAGILVLALFLVGQAWAAASWAVKRGRGPDPGTGQKAVEEGRDAGEASGSDIE